MDNEKLRKMEAMKRRIGGLIAGAIKDSPAGKDTGFCLLIFSFKGEEMTWISNAERNSMILAIEEFLLAVKTGQANTHDNPEGRN